MCPAPLFQPSNQSELKRFHQKTRTFFFFFLSFSFVPLSRSEMRTLPSHGIIYKPFVWSDWIRNAGRFYLTIKSMLEFGFMESWKYCEGFFFLYARRGQKYRRRHSDISTVTSRCNKSPSGIKSWPPSENCVAVYIRTSSVTEPVCNLPHTGRPSLPMHITESWLTVTLSLVRHGSLFGPFWYRRIPVDCFCSRHSLTHVKLAYDL